MNEDAKERSTTEQRRPMARYVLAIFLFLVVFLAIPYVYTSNPKSCTRCHDMEVYYTTWKASFHATAADDCFDCHVKQGRINIWIYRIGFYREIYASLVGADLKPMGATIPGVDSCRRSGCHSLNRVSSASGGIRIDHRGHVTEADISCVECHRGAAHPDLETTGTVTPPNKMCQGCHANRMNDCDYCHLKKTRLDEAYHK